MALGFLSGNGLRTFARYLWDKGFVVGRPFTVETLGVAVSSEVGADGNSAKAEMGEVSFDSTASSLEGVSREVLNEAIEIYESKYRQN